jgi:glycosyltransferase involved in cell wall biosynthesis
MALSPRVLYILSEYPQLSETYIQTEIDAVKSKHEIRIISTRTADQPHKNHDPFEMMAEPERIREVIDAFKPDVLHGHWMHTAPLVGKLSRETGIPFTLRAHSFDVLWKWKELSLLKRLIGKKAHPKYMTKAMPYLKDDLCLGVLSFPFGRANLERAGVPSHKIVDAKACINYKRFHDTGPNGDGIMNGGAALPKKKMDDFIELATLLPQNTFDLYPIGYKVEDLKALNAAKGSPVNIIPNIEPVDMPAIYKQHRWLVYTGASEIPTTGWPAMVAEAQAAGVGVLLKNLRPDMKEYVGPCGFVYDTMEDAARIISQPFPEELRQMGFEQARKSDIEQHKHLLTDLWDSTISKKSN